MGRFEKILEKATNATLIEPDWEAILLIVDLIRSAEVPAKPALSAIKKRCFAENPHAALHALLVLESVVKNCGDKVVREVATKSWMESLKELAVSGNEKVKEKVLELIQVWAHAFRDKAEFKIIKDTHQLMKLEGFDFQPWKESDALYAGESAPDWVDSSNCYRCHAEFGLITRKHHCRNCGQIFCDKCSSQTAIIPKFGIEKEVRVCETCFDKLKSKPAPPSNAAPLTPKEPTISSSTTPVSVAKPYGGKTEQELREEEELQIALAISQSEQEEKERMRQRGVLPSYSSSLPNSSTDTGFNYKGAMDSNHHNLSSTNAKNGPSSDLSGSEPELAKYLNREYWEGRRADQKPGILRNSPSPSAPAAEPETLTNGAYNSTTPNSHSEKRSRVSMVNGDTERTPVKDECQPLQNGDFDDVHQLVTTLRSGIEGFVNRIRSNQARGRSVMNDIAIQNQFMALTTMHSQLLGHMQDLDEKRGYYERLQDKVVQIRDAREAMTALREEHEQQRRAELAEAARQRHIAMAFKLETMRQKKHEMLEQQRLFAMQRIQQQEQELQYRKLMQQNAMFSPQANVYGMQVPGYGGMLPQYYPPASVNCSGPPPSLNYPQSAAGNPYQMQDMVYALSQQTQLPQSPGIPVQQRSHMAAGTVPSQSDYGPQQQQAVNVNQQPYMSLQQQPQSVYVSQQQPAQSMSYVGPPASGQFQQPPQSYSVQQASSAGGIPSIHQPPPPQYLNQMPPASVNQSQGMQQQPPGGMICAPSPQTQHQIQYAPATQENQAPPQYVQQQQPQMAPVQVPQPPQISQFQEQQAAAAEAQLICFD